MHKYTRSILGNPSQQRNKTQPILCYILQEKYLHHQENLEHKRVLTNPRRLAPKRGAHFSQVLVVVINTPSQLERYSSPSQFGEGVCNMFMCRKVRHMYCFPLHHVSENDILSQRVSIYHETQVSQRASHNSGYNHRIHLMIK
jgi:hypothetical protein